MLAACYARLGQIDEASTLLRSKTRADFEVLLGWFRAPDDRELLRAALAVAGADV